MKQDALYNEIGVCAQTVDNNPGSIVNTNENTYVIIFFKERESSL